MSPFRRLYSVIFNAIVAISVALLWLAPLWQARASAAALTPVEQAAVLLDQLTPEERVGQLFLVTFEGADVGGESQIAALINDYHIGGVVLLAENNNFTYVETSPQETPRKVIEINRQLQMNNWNSARKTHINPGTGEEYEPAYIPLLIGLSQEGDGYPYDQVLHGLTPLPNAMAIGATRTEVIP